MMTPTLAPADKPLVLILDHHMQSRGKMLKRIERMGRYEARAVYDPLDIPSTLEQTEGATLLISRGYAMQGRRELLALFIRLSELKTPVRIRYYQEPYTDLQAHLEAYHPPYPYHGCTEMVAATRAS